MKEHANKEKQLITCGNLMGLMEREEETIKWVKGN